MVRLIILLVILAVTIGVAAGIIYLVYLLFANLQPSTNKIRNDLARLKSALPPRTDLVPWNREEMELLSLDQVNQRLKKRMTTEAQGTIVSIYQEPMVNYVYKKYLGGKEDAILYLQTSNREFAYRIKNKATQVYMNQREIGTLKRGVLFNKRKKELAKIELNKAKELNDIYVIDPKRKALKEVGALKNDIKGDKINPRALDLNNEQFTDSQEDLLLAISLYYLVHQKVQP